MPWRAPVVIWSFGGVRCAEVGAIGRRAAVRVVPRTYRTGRASVVPVPCSYGVGLGALFVCCSLVVSVLFDICRLGDAVVSGPRETRLAHSRHAARLTHPTNQAADTHTHSPPGSMQDHTTPPNFLPALQKTGLRFRRKSSLCSTGLANGCPCPNFLPMPSMLKAHEPCSEDRGRGGCTLIVQISRISLT